jgi:flagellar biosynthesis protein FlhG
MHDQATQLRRLALQSRRSLSGADNAPSPRLLVVSGGRIGLGSTTVAVNLAVALAAHGSRAVLIDADLSRADVAAHCGLEETPTIADVLLGRRDIHETLQRGPGGIQVVAGTHTAEARNACSDRALQRVLRQIRSLGRHADLVVIDGGNGPNEPTIRLWQEAHDVFLVTTPDAVAVMDTYATVKTLLGRSAIRGPIRLVVSRVDDEDSAADVHRRIDQSCQRFLGLSLTLAGWIPNDPAALGALRRGQPLVISQAKSPFAVAIDLLAAQATATPSDSTQHQRRAA